MSEFVRVFYWYPPVGVFIGILGLLGVLVPLFRDFGKIGKPEKALWTLAMFLLVGLEIRSIYLERDAHDREQAAARAEEIRKFDAIAQGINATIANSDRQFTATMARTEQVLNNVTGGDSYAVVLPLVYYEKGGLIPVAIENHGGSILTGVSVTGYAQGIWMKDDPSFDTSLMNRVNVGTLHPKDRFVLATRLAPEQSMNLPECGNRVFIYIEAQNYSFHEYLDLKKDSGGKWLFEYQVYRQEPGQEDRLLERADWSDDVNKLNRRWYHK